MASIEIIDDGIMRLHGPSGAYHDFDPYDTTVEVKTIIQPGKGKKGFRVSVTIGNRTGLYPVLSPGEAASFTKEAIHLIKSV